MINRPGVHVIEGQAASPISGVSTNISALIGNFERGPVNVATLVGSMGEFERIFGSKPATGATGWHSVKAFFASAGNGYAPLYIVRVTSDSAAKSTLTIQDQNGSPVDTLKIDARSEGAWGNSLQVEISNDNYLSTLPAANITAGDESATLKSVSNLEIGSLVEFDNGSNQEVVRLTGVNSASKSISWSGGLSYSYTTENGSVKSLEFEIVVYQNNFEVERWPNLSMVNTVSHFCEKVVNGSSDYISVSDLKSSDTDEKDRPQATSRTSLTSGADGLDDVIGSDYEGSQADKTGLYALDSVRDLFRFCIPNPLLTDVDPEAAYLSLLQAAIDYAENRRTVSFYADLPAAKTVAQAVTFRDNFESKKASLWFPWLTVSAFNETVNIPASPAVIGAAAKKDTDQGVFKNIGNEPLGFAVGLEHDVSDAELETLTDANINAVKAIIKGGIRTYGGRTLSNETAWRFIHVAELWNYFARSIMESTESIVFQPNNYATWKTVERLLDAFFSNETARGALFDPNNPTGKPYVVVCDESTNPSDQVAEGILKATIEYVPAGTAERFVVVLTSQPTGLTVQTE